MDTEKDRRKVMPDLKEVYRSGTLEAATAKLDGFESRCGERCLRRAWNRMARMFAFLTAIRKIIYTSSA